MVQTSARLLRLLSLFQAQRYWSGSELSQRLDVTARTLRRDVDRLRSLGYPVHSTSGIAGGYQLGAGAALAPLHGFVVPLESRRASVDANLVSLLAGACRDHEGIRFNYKNRTDVPSMRVVEPYRVVHTGYRWYLVAWDMNRKDWRTFRVDRIVGKPKTSTRFKPRKAPEGDFAAFVAKSLSQVPYP